MKKYLFSAIIMVMAFFSLNAQITEVWKNGAIQAYVEQPDSIHVENLISSDSLISWTKAHLDSLTSSVMQRMRTELTGRKQRTHDPDFIREAYRGLGYNGHNVQSFNKAVTFLNAAVSDSLVANAKKSGNNKVVFIVGNPGAGKGTVIRMVDKANAACEEAGVIYDGPSANRYLLKSRLTALKEQGLVDQTVIFVHNTPEQSFSNACNRYLTEGRTVGLGYFTSTYSQYIGYVDYMETELAAMGVKRIYLSNEGNAASSESLVSADVAKTWDYTISDEMRSSLTRTLYDFFLDNMDKMSPYDVWSMLF